MTPSELGAFLARQRESLDLSLDEMEARTRIRRKWLEAMETGTWEALPPGVYTRGLLRNYARALGLATASVLRMYVKERPSEARLPEPQLISRPLIDEPRFNLEMLLAAALLLVAAGLFAWTVGTQLLPQFMAAPPGGPVADAPAAAAQNTQVLPPEIPPVTTPTPRARRTVGPLATATAKPSPTAVEGLIIEVEATNDAWLTVRTDGQEAFSGFLRQGEHQRWQAQTSVRLRTGNAGDTQITLNGQRLDLLGGRGDVEEREWRLLADGNIEQSS